MKASDVSKIVLVQAVESVDETGEILHFEERGVANAVLEGEDAGSPLEAESRRADVLLGHVKQRTPWLWYASQKLSQLSWTFTLVCALVAAVLGAGFQILDSGRTFHVLSLPLLGLLLWNAFSLVFLLLLPWGMHRLSANATPKDSVWGQRVLVALLWLRRKWHGWRWRGRESFQNEVAARALQAYLEEWLRHASGLLRAQSARLLHLCTMLFCVSALLTAYASGLTKAYRATWESTFLSSAQVGAVLQVLFTPSQWVLGPLPPLQANITGGPGLAAPWIHHYAVTLALFVLLPRLLLFAWTWFKSAWLSAYMPLSAASLSQVPTLNIALASHTNVGKTSLARTLLRRDVGEVRDEEHVTTRRAGYFLIHASHARLRLWDTPGFGDARVIARHLKKRRGWTWLRSLRDPKLRFDREAALALKDEADLILYLVPARPNADIEQTIREEWEVLQVIQRPVLCILNRLEGASVAEQEQLLEHWRTFFANEPCCREVLSLDAFSRTWQDEQTLFEAIERAVAPERRTLAAKLRRLWREQSENRHNAASVTLAVTLRQLSEDSERDTDKDAKLRLRDRAQQTIAEAQNKMLEQMGLESKLRDQLIARSEGFLRSMIPDRGERTIGAVIGGVLSGLASGIVTDFLAGGLTFGGGAALGLILGVVGGIGVAEGYRRIGASGSRRLAWDEDFLKGVALRLTLLYLAAASFGRARGAFTDEALPATESDGLSLPLQETETAHQRCLLQAAQTALHDRWQSLAPLLRSEQDSQVKKLWNQMFSSTQHNPPPAQLESSEGTGTAHSVEAHCRALLQDALQRWSQLRS